MLTIDQYFTPQAAQSVKEEIAKAQGNEVFFIGTTNAARKIHTVKVLARGNEFSVPAILEAAKRGQMIIHNHPSGAVSPSSADISVASAFGNRGVGSCIVDNDVTSCYVIVEPFEEQKIHRLDVDKAQDFFSRNGALSRHLEGYETRDQQISMLGHITDAFNNGKISVIEAGTGTGKTFTYLYPAIMWAVTNKQRCVVSTNTIHLQEQLFFKDLPLIQKASGLNFKFALVKGRNNYACLRKINQYRQNPELFETEDNREMEALVAWSQNTRDGSKSDLNFVPDPEVWEKIQSETDTSLKTRCPHYNECFYYKARRYISDADILVVNHHLLLSDLELKQKLGQMSQISILPSYTRVIVDEAHNIEDVATDFFTKSVSAQGVKKLLSKLYTTRRKKQRGYLHFLHTQLMRHNFASSFPAMEQAISMKKDIEKETTEIFKQISKNFTPAPAAGNAPPPNIKSPTQSFRLHREHFEQCLATDSLGRNIKNYTRNLAAFLSYIEDTVVNLSANNILPDALTHLLNDSMAMVNRIKETMLTMETVFFGKETGNVRWAEKGNRKSKTAIKINSSPLYVGNKIHEQLLAPYQTVVLTSATLSTGGNFNYFFSRSGLDKADTDRVEMYQFDSPFNFENQVTINTATDIPQAGSPDYETALSEALFKIVSATGGSTLALFTSYQVLDKTAELLTRKLQNSNIQVLVQGQDTRTNLLKRFKSGSGAYVLMGTNSFWEGIDVIGSALVCVVMVKLPFQVPSYPVIQARIEELEKSGHNSFAEYSLPMAVIRFKQGFGRLIRHKNDYGVIYILDPRIYSRAYGNVFLSSIPPCTHYNGPVGELADKTADFLHFKSQYD